MLIVWNWASIDLHRIVRFHDDCWRWQYIVSTVAFVKLNDNLWHVRTSFHLFFPGAVRQKSRVFTTPPAWHKLPLNGGTSDLSLRMHFSRRTGFILVVMIYAAEAPLSD